MALCLSRTLGETFTVDGPARITIYEVCGPIVRLRVEAPRSTTILRAELIDDGPDEREAR